MVLARQFISWAIVPALFFVLVGCRKAGTERPEIDTRFDENKAMFAAIRDANRLTLYEGLPRDQAEKEKERKETFRRHDYQFYALKLKVSAESTAKLKDLLADERSFLEWKGEKKCGGFHPDYLAEWRVGDVTYEFLICFGCHEVKVYGPNQSLRCDIHSDAYKQLVELLKSYRKNRPSPSMPPGGTQPNPMAPQRPEGHHGEY